MSQSKADPKKPWHEFWLVDESTDASDKADRWYYGRFHVEPYNHLPIHFQIKVIEHAALAEAQKEIAELKAELGKETFSERVEKEQRDAEFTRLFDQLMKNDGVLREAKAEIERLKDYFKQDAYCFTSSEGQRVVELINHGNGKTVYLKSHCSNEAQVAELKGALERIADLQSEEYGPAIASKALTPPDQKE